MGARQRLPWASSAWQCGWRMAESIEQPGVERDRLVSWVLGTFHAAFLITVAVVVLYLTGGLNSLLDSLGTLPGLALFLALWFTSVWSSRRALRGALGPGLEVMLPTSDVVGRAFICGGLNGLAFLPFLALILGIVALIQSPTSAPFVVLVGGIVFASFGAVAAFIIGSIVGVLFAGLDGLLVLAARYIVGYR